MVEDSDLADLMDAVSRTRRIDQKLTRLKEQRELSLQGFLHAYFPPIPAKTPTPDQDLE